MNKPSYSFEWNIKSLDYAKKVALLFTIIILIGLLQNCSNNEPTPEAKSLPVRWADVTLQIIKDSRDNSPTYASRSLGYIGLTMYESVVNGSSLHKSLAGQLNGLDVLPLPNQTEEYNWELSLNAGQAFIIKKLYPHMPASSLSKISKLEASVFEESVQNSTEEVAERSIAFGRAIASVIFEWSLSDGGHEGYLKNFVPDYELPLGPGYWVSPTGGQSAILLPLHPYWGNNRTFVTSNSTLVVPSMVPYSTASTSDHYKFFNEVYVKKRSLSAEERRIAAWWADDPTRTASPPGHSYNLASIAIASADSDMYTAAEVYAKVGMAVGDAFICCWKAKYIYHSERPFPFIRQYIDRDYTQFWPEPPFPAFPSGHATQSAAAAIAMISVFGENFSLVDDTYKNRASDFGGIRYWPRSYNTIWETAEECAYSRLLGGIHTRQDNEAGTEQGRQIGEGVINLEWIK